MISNRTRSYLFTTLLAAPPVVLVGAFCNSIVPQPEKVSAVIAANDPAASSVSHQASRAQKRQPVQIAQHLH